jgi:hypothetical protein
MDPLRFPYRESRIQSGFQAKSTMICALYLRHVISGRPLLLGTSSATIRTVVVFPLRHDLLPT